MERLSKIAICLGMGIAASVFILFVISIVPHIVDQVDNHWNEVIPVSKQEIMENFENIESYKIFVEKYPDHGRYLDLDRNGGRLELTAMNFETFNELRLELRYDKNRNNGDVREEISCSNDMKDVHYQIRGSLASQFIEKVNCLSESGLVFATSPIVNNNGYPVPIREPDGTPSYSRICGDGAVFEDGLCLVN